MTTMHGEIVSWDVASGTKVTYAAMKAALLAAGLDEKVAKELAPRNAFARACSDLATARVIRRVDETAAEMRFQFTKEESDTSDPNQKRLRYDFEAVLTLNKASGRVECSDNPALAAQAELMVKAESEVRYNCDITRVVQRLFELNADLFPVRSQGGCYFVPAKFDEFCGRVEHFLGSVGGSLRRFPVPAGYSKSGDRSVKESVEEGLRAVVADHLTSIAAFDDKTRDSTLEKMVERINTTRFKAEAYASFLDDKKAEIEDELKAARAALRLKITELGKGTRVPEPAVAPAAELGAK